MLLSAPSHITLIPRAFAAHSLRIARHAQHLSGNINTAVGAVIWKETPDGRYQGIAVNANRFPAGLSRHDVRYTKRYFTDFDLHAEKGAVVIAARAGKSTADAICTTTHCPCFECTNMMIEAGIREVIIDGAQKMRPRWFEVWHPKGQVTLDMLKRAGVQVEVHDLRLNEQNEPDIRMSKEELDKQPPKRFAISDSPRVVSTERGTALFHRSLYETSIQTSREPDPWLAVPANFDNNLCGLPILVQRAAHAARIELDRQRKLNPSYPLHAAVIFDERQPRGKLQVETSKPPRGSEEMAHTPEGAQAWSLAPGKLAVAHAARDGMAMEGKSVYLTHAPGSREAVVLAGAGIARLYIDSRSLPEHLDNALADRLWKGYVALMEAGVEVIFLHAKEQSIVVESIRRSCSQEVQEDIHIMDLAPAKSWAASHVRTRVQNNARNR